MINLYVHEMNNILERPARIIVKRRDYNQTLYLKKALKGAPFRRHQIRKGASSHASTVGIIWLRMATLETNLIVVQPTMDVTVTMYALSQPQTSLGGQETGGLLV